MQPIIITGFMGSGKTTVARALGRLLNRRATDLDQVITERENRSPKEIIEQDGEPAFREVETHWLREVLDLNSAGVIALGGGAWTLQRNRDLVTECNGVSVWLDAPFDLCWQRIIAAGNERPLAPNEVQAQRLYLARRLQYQLASFHLVAGEEKGVEALASAIALAIEKPG
jgi:shikimate kinase